MKLSETYKLDSLNNERRKFIGLRDAVIDDGRSALGVTVNGQYQDAAMVDAVRKTVIAEFNRRIASANAEIAALGVDIDD